MKQSRIFNGSRYTRFVSFEKKSDAKWWASRFRVDGKARVVKCADGWIVYTKRNPS